MSDIERYSGGPPPATAPSTAAATGPTGIRVWAEAAADAQALVTAIIDTPFVPESYRPKTPDRATAEQTRQAREQAVACGTAAVLYGAGIGLDPLTSLQQIIVVHGRPTMYARMQVALVLAAGHEVWTEDLTDHRAVVCGRRRGSDHVERVTVTIDQAKTAGWTRNPAYRSTPADMLLARASARVCDRVAPDVIRGLAVTEMADDSSYAGEEDTPTAPAARRRVARAKKPQAPVVEAPALPDPPVVETPPAPTPAPVVPVPPPVGESPGNLDLGDPPEVLFCTAGQQTRIKEILDGLGVVSVDDRRHAVSEVIGRQAGSLRTLTADEAEMVINQYREDTS